MYIILYIANNLFSSKNLLELILEDKISTYCGYRGTGVKVVHYEVECINQQATTPNKIY